MPNKNTIENDCLISASLLAADLANAGNEVKNMLSAGVNGVHFDVMDFHFVPNLSFGHGMCKALRDCGIDAPIEVHLMVDNPEKYVAPFAAAGASDLLFHPEAAESAVDLIKQIRDAGMKPGLVYSPGVDITQTRNLWPEIDAILIMTVEPGFGGQDLLPECLDQLSITYEMLAEDNLTLRLGVDGGICAENIARARTAGANWFISGSGLYKTTSSYADAVAALREQIALAQAPSTGKC